MHAYTIFHPRHAMPLSLHISTPWRLLEEGASSAVIALLRLQCSSDMLSSTAKLNSITLVYPWRITEKATTHPTSDHSSLYHSWPLYPSVMKLCPIVKHIPPSPIVSITCQNFSCSTKRPLSFTAPFTLSIQPRGLPLSLTSMPFNDFHHLILLHSLHICKPSYHFLFYTCPSHSWPYPS